MLKWNSPAGFDADRMEYEVTWKQSGLFGGQGTVETDDTEYKYSASGNLGLVPLTAQFTVRVKMKSGDWVGDTRAASATSVGLSILSVYMDCN